MLALPISRLGQSIVMPSASVLWTLAGIKELHPFEWSYQYVGITYFHGQSPGNYRRRTCA